MGVVKRTSMLVPASALPVEARAQVWEQARQLAIMGAQSDPALHDHDWALRMVNGVDLGLTGYGYNEQVSATAGAGNATYEASGINVGAGNTQRLDRFIVMFGVLVASSVDSLAAVQWVIGGARTHQWNLMPVLADQPDRQSILDRTLYTYPPPHPEWIDPVQIPSHASVQLEHYVRGGTAIGIQPSDLVYLGWVAEIISGGGAGLRGVE